MLVRNPKGKVVYIHQAENGKAQGKANYVLPELNSNKRTPQFGKNVKGSHVIGIVFLTLPIISYALMAAMTGTYLPFMAVSSQSMHPTLNQGDLIILRGEQAENIELGDIIAFNVPSPYDRLAPSPTVHRVIEKWTENEELFFVTKGDNNIKNDTWKIPAENLVGKYSESRIPYIGFIVIFLKSPLGLTLLVMTLVIFFVYDHYRKRDE
jgi:signal peptidase